MKTPHDVKELMTWSWEDFAPAYQELEKAPLSAANVEGWLDGWTAAAKLVDEYYNRAYVATSVNTVDAAAKKTFEGFMENIYPQAKQAEQRLKQKLLASGLQVKGFELQLRNMRSEAELYREANLPLEVEEEKLNTAHDEIMGAQTVQMDGETKTQRQLEGMFWNPDRAVRERAWSLMSQRQLQDRAAINAHWQQYMKLRLQIAKNADKPDYRAYRWQLNQRFDYTPEDAKRFQDSIEKAVVPFTMRLAEKRRQRLGLNSLRYFDIYVDYRGGEALKPFATTEELESRVVNAFTHVDPDFGKNLQEMRAAGLLDTGNRPNKAAGAYCTTFAWTGKPFIFGNAVGINDDVRTLLHEGGHAMHDTETLKLRWHQQRAVPMEFNEVASMAMEMLASPYLVKKKGGFYTEQENARSMLEQLELGARFWPYMAIVDAFQHWVYENPEVSIEPAACDRKWAELERRFRPYIDWSGAEEVEATGWQRKDHIHMAPFYYIEYGLAQMGAAQVWGNSLKDERAAVHAYRSALKLGGTATLPEIYKTAGARLAFDAATLGEVIALYESKMNELEALV